MSDSQVPELGPQSTPAAILRCLTCVDPAEVHLRVATQVLEQRGVAARVEYVGVGKLEICMSVELDGSPLEAAIDLAEWCKLHIEGGDRLAFDKIDPAYLLPIVERDMHTRLLNSGDASFSAWRAHEVRRVLVAEVRLRILAAKNGFSVWLRSWPGAAHRLLSSRTPWRPSFNRLAVPVTLRVGRSQVTRRLLRRASPGDLLLIRQRDWEVRVGNVAIGIFSISGEGWKMDAFEERRRVDGISPERVAAYGPRTGMPDAAVAFGPSRRAEPPPGTSVDPARLDEIPVEAEFLLPGQSLTLSELRTMQIGTTFRLEQHPLSQVTGISRPEHSDGIAAVDGPVSREVGSAREVAPRAYPVEVRIHGQRVAQAELVALGDQLAVQIVRLDGLF